MTVLEDHFWVVVKNEVIMNIAQSTRVLLDLLLSAEGTDGEMQLSCLQSDTGLHGDSPKHCSFSALLHVPSKWPWGPSQYPIGLHPERVLVRRPGLTTFAAYLT